MLAINRYTQEYIDACRTRLDEQLAAYRAVAATASPQALAAFEPLFFNNLVLVLDHDFLHRARALELKDGNPINEVRVLCNSLQDGGRLLADKSIKLKPQTSVLGYAVGDEIRIDEAGFTRLADAYFAEVRVKYA